MWLIERLWIDTLENRDAYGWKPIGISTNEDDKNLIVNSSFIRKDVFPWPLKYAHELPNPVPRFRATKIEIVQSTMTDLRAMKSIHEK
jgi:hypothetical protein